MMPAALALILPAHAGADPPRGEPDALTARAASEPVGDRPTRARFVPRLRVGFSAERIEQIDRRSWDVGIWAELGWPLDPVGARPAGARGRALDEARTRRAADARRRRAWDVRRGDLADDADFDAPAEDEP